MLQFLEEQSSSRRGRVSTVGPLAAFYRIASYPRRLQDAEFVAEEVMKNVIIIVHESLLRRRDLAGAERFLVAVNIQGIPSGNKSKVLVAMMAL